MSKVEIIEDWMYEAYLEDGDMFIDFLIHMEVKFVSIDCFKAWQAGQYSEKYIDYVKQRVQEGDV